ncbi:MULTISPECIES: FkbM family methyltransferase [unclassified Streptomyces]|uniref:FkbM family methyltransferase n=1 Tax=unclassified Streptomyces TaxID=2593676 RepID=UPI00342F3605
MRQLRRDEDAPGTGVLALLRRELRTAGGDVVRARSRWGGPTGRRLARSLIRYHWLLATAHNGSQERRSLRFRRNGTDVVCHFRDNPSDLYVLREIFLDEIYRFPYEDHCGTPVRRIIDMGSNIGLSPLYFALLYPEAAITAVEPVAENLDVLRANRLLNGTDWNVMQAAVADKPGTVTLYPSGWWSSSSTVRMVAERRKAHPHRPESRLGRPAVQVAALTVPEVFARAGWDSVDILKMDIEGAEEAVLLADDTSWLDRVGVLALDIHEKYVDRQLVLSTLAAHGFRQAAESGHHSAVFVRTRHEQPNGPTRP